MSEYRIETDSIGEIKVEDKYFKASNDLSIRY